MNDIVKWLAKTSSAGILWVFLLSITVEGRTIFSYANSFLVQNALVRMLDEELGDLWYKVYTTAQTTYHEIRETDEETM